MTTTVKPENIGASNPYALAEVILKKKVNWKRVNVKKLLEQTHGMPYEKLFDPKYESPLYPGAQFNPETKSMKRVEIPPASKGAYRALLDVGDTTVWADPGDFFEGGAPDMNDPIQGASPDCYLISALSSLAWARPYIIAERTWMRGGVGHIQMIEFLKSYGGSAPAKIEVTELIPLNSPSMGFIYARSSESGEIWPAVYEKAFAKWRNGNPVGPTGDKPDYAKIAYGDPVAAAAAISGLTPYYYSNPGLSEDDIWIKINNENCASNKTFNPMMAWTYGSSPSADVNYSSAHIAANHAYSILGSWKDNVTNKKYIVLRNPWGNYESTLNVEGGTWSAWDAVSRYGCWTSIPMATVDGIFALRVDTFKKYFAGFGLVK